MVKNNNGLLFCLFYNLILLKYSAKQHSIRTIKKFKRITLLTFYLKLTVKKVFFFFVKYFLVCTFNLGFVHQFKNDLL